MNEFLGRFGGDYLFARRTSDKVVDLRGVAVENGNGKTVSFDVHRQILAHHGEADHADLCGLCTGFWSSHCIVLRLTGLSEYNTMATPETSAKTAKIDTNRAPATRGERSEITERLGLLQD